MSLVCVASALGSPGGTTTSLALGASWPKETDSSPLPLLLEANPDGGILAIRYQLPTEPGLSSLAAAERFEINTEQILKHSQQFPGGLHTILAPDSPYQVELILKTAARGISKALKVQNDFIAIVDCGRLRVESPASIFYEDADLFLMVARPESEQLISSSHFLTRLREKGINAGWVLIGEKPYTANEVHTTFDHPIFGIIPYDKKGADILRFGGKSEKLTKSPLMRSASEMALKLAQQILALKRRI